MVQINWISDYFNSMQKNIQTRSVWNIWSWIIICVLLLLLISYIYSIFLKQDLDEQIWEKLEQSQEIASAISAIQSNNEHRKYQYNIYMKKKEVYNGIQLYNLWSIHLKNYKRNITINDLLYKIFKSILIKTIVKGSAQNLEYHVSKSKCIRYISRIRIYKKYSISYYKKFTDNFEFLLEATLQ